MSVKDNKRFDFGEYNETAGNFLINACTVRAYFNDLEANSTDARDRQDWHEKSKQMGIVIDLVNSIIYNSPSKYVVKLKEEAVNDDDVVVAPRCKRQAIDPDAQENDNEVIEARIRGHNIEEDDERPTRPPSPVENENKEPTSSASSSSSSSSSSARPHEPEDDDEDNEEEEEEEDDDDDDNDDDIVFPPAPFNRIVTRTIVRPDGSTTTFTFTE